MAPPTKRMKRAPKRPRAAGTGIIWPRGLRDRYGVSGVTIWRWQRAGRLPARDAFLNGVAVGWKPSTIDAVMRGEKPARDARRRRAPAAAEV